MEIAKRRNALRILFMQKQGRSKSCGTNPSKQDKPGDYKDSMYLSNKQRQIDDEGREIIMEVVTNGLQPPTLHSTAQQQQMILADSSGEDHEVKAPKKRAETWVQEEIRALIAFRREMDGLFNTSKSNKHLWEQISLKMRERGFDRSPTMCTDKWRNLLKEYKKAKHQDRGGGSAKMSCYKDLEELLRERAKTAPYKTPPAKVDAYIHFSPKGRGEVAEQRQYVNWAWIQFLWSHKLRRQHSPQCQLLTVIGNGRLGP
eukprot:Gb_26181 [translate_table: standard]